MNERLPNQEPSRLTDEQLVERSIERALEFEAPIDAPTARVIASKIHNGQTSAMYAFASTGVVSRHLELELNVEHRFAEDNDTPEVRRWVEHLQAYIAGRESHDAVDGWSSLWLQQPEFEDAGLDEDDCCVQCGAHFSDPHEPGCPLQPEENDD